MRTACFRSKTGMGGLILLVLAFTAIAGEKQAPGPAAGSWPSFRGPAASGVLLESSELDELVDAEAGTHLRFKVAIPGLAHSSPVIHGARLFVTTAVSSRDDASFKHGLYGSGDASDDRSVHRFQVRCLDKKTGKLLWEKTAHEGKPKDKRHIKATYANSSPVTDGRYVIAWFGSPTTRRTTSGARPAPRSFTRTSSSSRPIRKATPSSWVSTSGRARRCGRHSGTSRRRGARRPCTMPVSVTSW